MYYLARSLSSQLSLITNETDYNSLEKCYSIWICRDNIPQRERYSISFYGIQNKKNIGGCYSKEENYDLLELTIIRLGDEDCPTEYDLLEFLNALFYPHKRNFLDTVQKYTDFSKNEELKGDVSNMSGLGMSILEEGIEKGKMEAKLDSARKMLLGNMEISFIMEITDLSKEKWKD